MVNVLYRLKIYKDINLINKLNLFSNYLYHTERVDVAYNGTLNFRLNKLITTKYYRRFALRPRSDREASGKTNFRNRIFL